MKIISKPTLWAIYSSWVIFLIFLTSCIKYHEPVVKDVEESDNSEFKNIVYITNGRNGSTLQFYTNQTFKVGDTLRSSNNIVTKELPQIVDKDGYIVRRIITHPDEGQNQIVSHLNLTSAENSV